MAKYCENKGYIVLLDKQSLAKPLQKKKLLDVTDDLAKFIQEQK
ncbi:MAG: hypothetical protein NZ551_05265 [Microscillaceae bacterium]|nr:hypothetical protein [Microscillaceae bacterium]MDW8460604.1 hypothetical protein [Cytophagales bacterium]